MTPASPGERTTGERNDDVTMRTAQAAASVEGGQNHAILHTRLKQLAD